ncbi:Cmx/CmrA family chloramphenicol efflux MFS transporter [Actinomadura citrea]|uniref:DHA1 family chloramphenicol resistance protein-like MFS transporter n=1 Tax=Actinomadura citrea TaxID=46158 RepID=A0A7Y9GEU6_9ACTN|nr:Cmx/CmrA family chloramphenicol efflux MFS transporter [Actinomadura citrea]NYE15227.1 DHA1 family chloramphenicol resistance protein-like MFS transporter [Actinomadura citrea]GGT94281.1 chloramphenicol resistance protein [Actinomadura citrea]
MPFAVYVLGLAVFAQGTSEFMLSGLVPGIAADLGVSIPAAGLLTSAFAVGMVIGAPSMTLLARRWPRRRALLIFLAAFVAVHVVGALTTSYAVLLATRVAAALANAGFWAVALAAATALVPPAARARATSVVVGGVTVACVAGVPAGALLGGAWGWRAAFWAVALVSLPAVVAIARAIPEERPSAGSARSELRALAGGRLLLTLSVNALFQGATFCTFTYLAPLATNVAGFGSAWVPALLALFGAGSLAGVTIGGRIADAHPAALIAAGMTSLTAGWAVLALTAGSPAAVVVLVFVQGMLAFGTGPALISRVLEQGSAAPTLAGGFATAAFNVGGTLGPWLGGTAIAAGLGYRSPVWVSALLMAGAIAVLAGQACFWRARLAEPVSAGR